MPTLHARSIETTRHDTTRNTLRAPERSRLAPSLVPAACHTPHRGPATGNRTKGLGPVARRRVNARASSRRAVRSTGAFESSHQCGSGTCAGRRGSSTGRVAPARPATPARLHEPPASLAQADGGYRHDTAPTHADDSDGRKAIAVRASCRCAGGGRACARRRGAMGAAQPGRDGILRLLSGRPCRDYRVRDEASSPGCRENRVL